MQSVEKLLSISQALASTPPRPNNANVPGPLWGAYGIAMGLDPPPLCKSVSPVHPVHLGMQDPMCFLSLPMRPSSNFRVSS